MRATRTSAWVGDLTGAGCDVDEAAVRAALEEKSVEAKRQLMSES